MKRYFIIILTLLVALMVASTASALDTSINTVKKSDLNDFGKWLYSQPGTDLDLCVEYQSDSVTTYEDSMSVLESVIIYTSPRRTAWLAKNAQMKPVLTQAERYNLRAKYCATELGVLNTTLSTMQIGGAIQAQRDSVQKAGLAHIDSLVTERAFVDSMKTLAQNLALYLPVTPDTAITNLLTKLDKRVTQLEQWKTEVQASLSEFAKKDWVETNFRRQ